jgi:signal transduction histidine kinase
MKDKSANATSNSNKLIWIGIGLAAFWWFLESTVHVFVFHEGGLLQQILAPEAHELWMRSVVVVVLVVFAIYAQVIITKRKQAEEALRTYHEKLDSLVSKLSLAEERQRRRMAIEVHDRISQNLAFVKMKLGTLRASTSSSSLAGAMDEMLKLVDETIQNTRALISELGSPVLYELGFVPAVEWLTQQTQKQHGIAVDFDDDGRPKPLSEDVRVLLFQAVRELLVNIAKHAQARTAKVSITRSDDQVRVDVGDDGVGFEIAEIGSSVDTTGSFGLFSIRMRLESLGGDMEVQCKPGHGTRVTLIAPLKHNGGNKKEKVS